MALNAEQQLMEEKIISAGYQLKFDSQLHALKKGLIDRSIYLEKKKVSVTDAKIGIIREFVDTLPEESKTFNEDDADGNSVEKTFTDSELNTMGEAHWKISIDQFDLILARIVENLSWIESEISFRNDGLVEREPTGTTYYVDPMQYSNGSTYTDAWRYLYLFVNVARSPGDVCICRRVRGGFNTNDEIFINRYSRYKFTNDVGNDSLSAIGNFDSQRDVGYQSVSAGITGKGTILGWNQTTDNYGHDTGKNRSNTAVTHAQKAFIGDSHGNGADQVLYGTSGATPRSVYLNNISPLGSNYQATFHTSSRYLDLYANTNPRDKSRLVHLQHNYWDMSHETTFGDRLIPLSNGDMDNPIIVTADYENRWQDFLDTGIEDSAIAGWGHDGDDTQYTVETGSKIIRRKTATGDPVEVHSYITPGDWIFVGQLTADPIRKVDATYSDDPYEYSYQVRDVNYDKIVLWLPYKGEQEGSNKRLVSMGYAPRMFSCNYNNGVNDGGLTHKGSKMHCNAVENWFFQGIEWFDSWQETSSDAYTEDRNTQLVFQDDSNMKFKDCSFFGSSNGDNNDFAPASAIWQYRHTTAIVKQNGRNNQLEFDKCVFGNTKNVVYDGTNTVVNEHGKSHYRFSDCLMNGAIMDNQFSNMRAPKSFHTWNNHSSKRLSHRFPMSAIYSRRQDTNFEFYDCELVNWKYSMFKVSVASSVSCRGVKFLGCGMDFVDPTATNDADAQENLGLRYSRALFAGDNTIHPTTSGAGKNNDHLGTGDATLNGGWEYDMIYPNADATANGPNANNKVIDMSSASSTFGEFKNKNFINMGSKFFIHTGTDLTIGANSGVTSTKGASYNSNLMTRVDANRIWQHQGWRNNSDANSAGAFGYVYQPTDATGGLEPITINNGPEQTFGDEPGGYNDNQTGNPTNTLFNDHDDQTVSGIFWDNHLFFNGALAILGAKGFDNKGCLVWDWDQYWRSGNADVHNNAGTGSGGSWALRTSDGKVRYPHVYGGVRIPPSISELLGRFMSWYSTFKTAPTDYSNMSQNNNPGYHSNNDTGSSSAENSSNNSTLAPKNAGADNRDNDGAIWGGNYTSSANSFDWQLSNGCGFGIGCAPMHGIITEFSFQGGNHSRNWNQSYKKTSQDHYQMFLNYDYNQYSAKGYLTSKWEQFQDKPFLTGIDGIGKGIVWQQGRLDHWHVVGEMGGGNEGASNTVGYRENSNSGEAGYRATGYQWMTPLMETVVDNTLIQSGGGNYLIKVYPPWMLGRGMTLPNPHDSPDFTNTISDNYERQWRQQTSMLVFEYPFYLSKNSRTYTVNIRPDVGTSATEFSWLANPTGQDVYLEMDFFDTDTTTDRLQQSRKLKRSNSSIDMNTDAWSQLSVTVTPKSEGVGYLRLWYGKARETGKVNTFYVDPKVVVY